MKKLIIKVFKRIFDEIMEIKKDKIISSLKYCGDNFTIQEPFYLSGYNEIVIGNNVSIAAFVHIWGQGGVNIGNNVLIASHTAITSLTHNPQSILFNSELIKKSVLIGDNVWIGSHSVILPGVKIGNNCIIGAGSIVNKDIPDNTVFAGVPAKELYKLPHFRE
jgi:maltose O-acetyltransferase